MLLQTPVRVILTLSTQLTLTVDIILERHSNFPTFQRVVNGHVLDFNSQLSQLILTDPKQCYCGHIS